METTLRRRYLEGGKVEFWDTSAENNLPIKTLEFSWVVKNDQIYVLDHIDGDNIYFSINNSGNLQVIAFEENGAKRESKDKRQYRRVSKSSQSGKGSVASGKTSQKKGPLPKTSFPSIKGFYLGMNPNESADVLNNLHFKEGLSILKPVHSVPSTTGDRTNTIYKYSERYNGELDYVRYSNQEVAHTRWKVMRHIPGNEQKGAHDGFELRFDSNNELFYLEIKIAEIAGLLGGEAPTQFGRQLFNAEGVTSQQFAQALSSKLNIRFNLKSKYTDFDGYFHENREKGYQIAVYDQLYKGDFVSRVITYYRIKKTSSISID
ncbi:MAG: hypothetical protein ACPGQC_00800 [Limisphaerales bacterium]